MKRALFSLAWLLAAGAPVPAQEVQRHGLVFEQWVRATFFDGYKLASHTQRWDIPATANQAHGGAPQPQEHPALFSVEYPGSIASKPRGR